MKNTLLSDFAAKRWAARPFERLSEMLRLEPDAANAFAEDALSQVPQGGTFFDLTLSHVSERAFNQLISLALQRLAVNPKEEAASSVIAYASLQFPRLLHPHLVQLFALAPNVGTYYENWPWRDSGALALPSLNEAMRTADPVDRLKAWLCLLETRHAPALQFAIDSAASVGLRHPLESYLHEVGFETPKDALFAPSPLHLMFPTEYFADARPAWSDRSLHPTWLLAGDSGSCRFGGVAVGSCSLCSGTLHHLITVADSSTAIANAATPVSFATCLSCLGWERQVLYYSHGKDGLAQPLDAGKTSPRFPAVAIKECAIRLAASPSRWCWQDWGLSNDRENLNRFGGYPTWIQSAEYPTCLSCQRIMRFAFQLDSALPNQEDGEWMWGSGGICYGFWCSSCRVSALLWQCT
jgi:hypothetical protein